jgi:hypothetical protein
MKFRILRGFMHNGKTCAIDDIVEFSDHEVRRYLEAGKVVPHDETVIENRVDVVQNLDPKPVAKSKKVNNVD